MRAREVLEHFREVGHWVDWENGCDEFLHGDPDVEIKGIAVAWIPTNKCLKNASDKGLNLFITHEPVFYHESQEIAAARDSVLAKKKLLDELGITVLRCHDTWDRMPGVGIPDAWAEFLGFETEERPVRSFYKTCLLGDVTVEEAAKLILGKVRSLGQDTVLIFGDRHKRVGRMAVGTGAITRLPKMYELKPDVILATDDGMNFWNDGLWAKDIDMPILIVNHCTAEKPGMKAMAQYLKERFADIPVEYLDVEFPYSSL